MKKNLISLSSLLVVVLAALGTTSPVLAAAAPQIPALGTFVMHPDGGVIVPETETGRVLYFSPKGQMRTLVAVQAGLKKPIAVGVRKEFLYVQDAQGIFKVLPEVRSLTAKNALFQFVQAPSSSDQPFVKITSPSAGDLLTTDQPITIAWAHNLGTDARFTIELSDDNGDHWEPLAFDVSGSHYTWQAPPTTEFARLRIRQSGSLLSRSGGSSTDTSDEPFVVGRQAAR